MIFFSFEPIACTNLKLGIQFVTSDGLMLDDGKEADHRAVGMLRLTLSVHIATEPRGKRTRTLVFHECFTCILHHH